MAGDVIVRVFESEIRRFVVGPEVGRDLARRAIKVQAEAKRLCPVDTGRLRSSIQWAVAPLNGSLVAAIGTDVEYARYVHDGTRFMAGRPFLTDALPAGAI